MCTKGTHWSHAKCHPYPIPQPVKVDHTGRLSLLKIRGLFKTVRTLFTEKSRNPPMVIKSHKVTYRKIAKISLVTQKTFREIAPPNISPPGGSYLEIALKYKVKQRKNSKSILRRKLPPVLKPLKKGLWKKICAGAYFRNWFTLA